MLGPCRKTPTVRFAARSRAPWPRRSGPLEQPIDKRVFGSRYDDLEILGKAVTRRRAWPAVGFAIHVANGAAFGAIYARLAPRMPLPVWSRGPAVALAENFALWPLTLVTDRLHPARDGCRSSPRAARRWPRRRGAICCSA